MINGFIVLWRVQLAVASVLSVFIMLWNVQLAVASYGWFHRATNVGCGYLSDVSTGRFTTPLAVALSEVPTGRLTTPWAVALSVYGNGSIHSSCDR